MVCPIFVVVLLWGAGAGSVGQGSDASEGGGSSSHRQYSRAFPLEGIAVSAEAVEGYEMKAAFHLLSFPWATLCGVRRDRR